MAALFIALQILDGLFKRPLANAGPLPFWTYDALLFIALPAAALWPLRGSGGLRRLGLALREPGWGLADLGALAALLAMTLGFLYAGSKALFSALLPQVPLGALSFAWESLLPPPGAGRTLFALYLALTAGFAEELFYRALLFEALGRKGPQFVAVSSILFAFAHWEQGLAALLASGAYGAVAAEGYRRVPLLWPFALAHAAVDFAYFW